MLNKFLYHSLVTMIWLIYLKLTSFIYPYICGLRLDSSKLFWNALVIVLPILSFKGKTHAYLLKTPVKHNKIRFPLLYLLINCISFSQAPQILPWRDYNTVHFLNFWQLVGIILLLTNSASELIFVLLWVADLLFKKNVNHWSKTSLVSIIF